MNNEPTLVSGDKYKVKTTGDLREDNPEKCILIGTLYKDQALKPSILREISEEAQLAPQPIKENFAQESDKLVLEDELQRIRIWGKLEPQYFVTGIVCAVLGKILILIEIRSSFLEKIFFN